MNTGKQTGDPEEDKEEDERKEERKREIMELRETRKREARKKLCILDANVDGINGVQRMLECLGNGLEAEVVVIQESRCSEKEERKLESQLSRQGWYMYHLPGTSTVINKGRKKARGKGEAEIRENGGVMIWVRKGLEQKLIHKESQGEARILAVDVQG